MSQYANLKAAIAANVYQNHNNEVTANMVKAAMNAMTDSLGAGYQYLGIATPATTPGTPDQKVFYIAATPGDYANFGTGISVADGEVAILKFDTAWHKEVTGAATAAQVTELGQYVASNTGLPLIKEQILHKNDILYEGENVPTGRKMLFDFAIGYITLYKGNVVDRYIGTSSEATVTEYTIPSGVTRIIVGSNELDINQIRFLDIRTNKELGQDIEETNIYVGFKKVVLNGIGTSGVGFFTKVGDCYYNTTQNKIARCLTYTDETHFTQEYTDPQESVIYIVGGVLYTYNGTTLVSYTPARQEYYHKQFNSAINDIKPYTIPACDELPITEITVNTNNGYTAANGEIVAAPISYEDLIKEFYDKYIGYYKDGYCVTKTEIGRTIDSGHTYPLYEFDFMPKRYNKIVMISAGMNAQELTPIFGLALFIKNIMDNHESDAGLKYLYENVRFKIVPIINVWGYHQTDLQYKNANGVSINNNWDYDNSWSDDTHTNPSSTHYKGTSPFSEEETKILKRWLTINGRSAELWIDCHSGVGVQSDVANLKTFYTFASPVSLLYEIKNCQQKIISFYQSKGYSPTPAMCGIGMSYPKTEDAFRTYGVKAIMIEQYPNAPGYGGSGETDQTLQNKDVDLTNYVLMLRAYTLIALKNKAYQFDNNDIAYMLYQWKLNNIGRDNINAKFPLYSFYHGEIAESYTRRGTDKIPVAGGSDTVFIVPISDVEIVDCRFYTANGSTAVSKGQDGNIIYTTLSGQQYFRTTFKRGLLDSLTNVDEGMDYYGIDRTMVEIEINGECYNHHYDFTHHSFNSNKEVVLNTTRDRVMSPYYDVTGGDYIFTIDNDFVLVDLLAFNQYRNYPVRVTPNGNIISIPSDKTLLRATFRRNDGSVINLIDTDRIIKEFFKVS